VRPNYGGEPVTVGVTLFILSIEDLSEKFMDFTFDMYFRQFWQDPRLSFERRPNLEKLVVGAEYIKLIWVPDTFFVNEKVALFHQATTENQFLRIMHTGEILRSMRLTIKATCPMDLSNFPMDSQTCTVEIESFGYTMTDLRYKWNDGMKSVQMSSDVSLPQFNVLGHRQRIIEASLSSGNYSRLLADVHFVRSMGYYIIQVGKKLIIEDFPLQISENRIIFSQHQTGKELGLLDFNSFWKYRSQTHNIKYFY
jgi:glycine receptor alpha-3